MSHGNPSKEVRSEQPSLTHCRPWRICADDPHMQATTDIPTTPRQAGYPSLGYDPILGLFGPTVMTAEVRQKIAADLRTVSSDPSLQARLTPTGQIVDFVSTNKFAESGEIEREEVTSLAKMLDIHPGQ
jgi:tripartite-type tricarboxylate transporter receptor subunit TctC